MNASERTSAALAQADLLVACVRAFGGEVDQADDLRAERTRLFEIPGVCPPYEAAWVRRDKGAILGDISGFYRAFGFQGADANGVRPDHLAAQLEFLAVLRVMEAQALQRGALEAADITREAYVNFLLEHISEWIAPFCARLKSCTALGELHECCDLIETMWNAEAASNHVPPFDQLGSDTEPEPFDANGGTPYECLAPDVDECDGAPRDGFVQLTTSGVGGARRAGEHA